MRGKEASRKVCTLSGPARDGVVLAIRTADLHTAKRPRSTHAHLSPYVYPMHEKRNHTWKAPCDTQTLATGSSGPLLARSSSPLGWGCAEQLLVCTQLTPVTCGRLHSNSGLRAALSPAWTAVEPPVRRRLENRTSSRAFATPNLRSL